MMGDNKPISSAPSAVLGVRMPAVAPDKALTLILIGGYLVLLATGLPGHMSTDSVIQLAEGRLGVQRSFNPAFMSLFLGVLDKLLPGTALFVVLNSGLLFGSLLLLTRLTSRVRWYAVPIAFGMLLTPQILIYQAIVWKDVFFANSAIAAFVCLGFAARAWDDPIARRIPWIASLLLFVVAALVRQNGALALMGGSAAIGMVALGSASDLRRGWMRGLAATGALFASGLAITAILTVILGVVIPPANPNTNGVGLRIIEHYDIVGVAALDPTVPLTQIDHFAPSADDTIRSEANLAYSPLRIDQFDASTAIGPALWGVPTSVIQAQWVEVVRTRLPIYLRHRDDVFSNVFFMPEPEACLLFHVGVAGPPEVLAELQMDARLDGRDARLALYGQKFSRTPVFSHLAFAILAVATMGALALRRTPVDLVVCGLLVSALAFAASFYFIGIACDYRYIYFLDLAAMVSVLYLASDPPSLVIEAIGFPKFGSKK